jgi:hypothetical protein
MGRESLAYTGTAYTLAESLVMLMLLPADGHFGPGVEERDKAWLLSYTRMHASWFSFHNGKISVNMTLDGITFLKQKQACSLFSMQQTI